MQNYSYGDFKQKLPIIIKGTLLGVAVTIFSMIGFAALMLIFNMDRKLSLPFSTTSLAIGCLLAAMYTAKKVGHKGYIIGFIIGVIVFVLVTALSLIITGDGFSYNTLFHFVIILIASITGGILGVNRGRKNKYI